MVVTWFTPWRAFQVFGSNSVCGSRDANQIAASLPASVSRITGQVGSITHLTDSGLFWNRAGFERPVIRPSHHHVSRNNKQQYFLRKTACNHVIGHDGNQSNERYCLIQYPCPSKASHQAASSFSMARLTESPLFKAGNCC